MTIFRNTVKRIFRNKIQIFFIILFPLAFMMLGFIGNQPSIKTAVIDHDDTELTAHLIESLKSKTKISRIEESEIEKKLMTLRVDYVLVIEKGFTEDIILGNSSSSIKGYSVEESNFSISVHSFLDQWVGHVKMIAEAVNHEADSFYTVYKNYDQDGIVQLKQSVVIDQGANRTQSVLGYLIISILYTSLIVGLHIIVNKNNHTIHRTLAAPISIRNYMFQTIASFLFVSFIQISFVMIVLKWIYKLYMGDVALQIYLLLLLFSLVAVSFGVAISAMSKTIIQACLIGICLIAPMAMLGGAYFPLDWAPDIIKTISHFTPVSWVINGIESLLHGQSLFSLEKEIMILLLYSAIFFLLGTLRKTDIAK